METEPTKTQADAPQADAQTPAKALAETPVGGPDGRAPDLRRRFNPHGPQGRLSDEEVHQMMTTCARFLWQLTAITSGVLHTLDVGCVRDVVAADIPVPKGAVDENGQVLKQARPARADPSTGSGRDHRKEPRGRKHPLTVWLGLTLQGVRILLRMTEGTNPEAHNREPLLSRIQREELRAQEREFATLFKGS